MIDEQAIGGNGDGDHNHTCKSSSNSEKMEQNQATRQMYIIGFCFCQARCNRVHSCRTIKRENL